MTTSNERRRPGGWRGEILFRPTRQEL